MIKVRITPTISHEYEVRAVYDFIAAPGVYHLTLEQASELRDDAIFQALEIDLMPPGPQRAYSALASNLMAALDGGSAS